MKNRVSPYIRAEQLIKEHAAIDIANLITNNERLLNACKLVVEYVDNGIRVESRYSGMCRQAIQKAEGK